MAEQARILVVDDEPAVQNALFRALTLEHYDVTRAGDGQEALERLGAAPYEAVILDIAMPRVDGLAHSVSKYENASFGGQYSQACNQLFDLQQLIEPHLAYLLKNQDNAMLIIQTNLASCQNELNFAEHDKEGHATPMKNIAPDFKGRKRTAHVAPTASGPKTGNAKGPAKGKPVVDLPKKTQKK